MEQHALPHAACLAIQSREAERPPRHHSMCPGRWAETHVDLPATVAVGEDAASAQSASQRILSI
jgi:hypothetical protein